MPIDLRGTLEAMLGEAEQYRREARVPEAIDAYKRLLESWPGLPNCWYELGVLQRKTRDFAGALVSYGEALERRIDRPEEVHLNRGVIFADFLHDHEAAEREIKAALILNPTYLPAFINLANLYEDLGRRERAIEVYERLLAVNVGSPQILARHAGLKNFRDREDPILERIRRALAQTDMQAADRASLGFALGRALDECGEYDAAFRAYLGANRDSRASAGPDFRDYDMRELERYVDRLIAAFPTDARVSGPGIYSPKVGATQPIFICGMFRSGCSLAEQLLAGHPAVAPGGELNLLLRFVQDKLMPFPESLEALLPGQLASFAVDYVEGIQAQFSDVPFVTDRRPENFFLIGLIKTLFPAAQIVHTTRDALDNCLSIYFQHLDPLISYALDLADIGHYYRQYQRLMTHWKACFGGDIFDLNFDALVTDTTPVVEQLLGFLRLPLENNSLVAAPVGQLLKNPRVKSVRGALDRRASGRSVHYERQLRGLSAYLRSSP